MFLQINLLSQKWLGSALYFSLAENRDLAKRELTSLSQVAARTSESSFSEIASNSTFQFIEKTEKISPKICIIQCNDIQFEVVE